MSAGPPSSTSPSVGWIELDGAVNVRDLGGTPTVDGRHVLAHRLIRADNLQGLSPADVRRLHAEHDVRRVVDLRTGIEVRGEGPGPLTRDAAVRIAHLSLFVEPDAADDAPAGGRDVDVVDSTAGPQVLPWQGVAASDETRVDAVDSYVAFLTTRPENVLAALRMIAEDGGATIVHCAAGKDRTGVIVALALAALGVADEEIVADYARSAERIEKIVARLAASPTYAADIATGTVDHHRPRPDAMRRFLLLLHTRFGGASGWLRSQGWTAADQEALDRALLSPRQD